MATVTKGKFKCPHCNEEFEADLYKAVDVKEDSKYRNMLINGEFFKYECPHCHKLMMAVYPMLYIDSRNNFLIQYVPHERLEEMHRLIIDNRNSFPKDYNFRIVTATYDAVEKMIIFENRLDDRIIECNKVIIHKAFLERYEGKVVHHIYFNVDKDKNFVFDVIVKDKEGKQEVLRATFDVELYNHIYKDFRKELNEEDLIVDYGYGLRKMKDGPKANKSTN